MNYHQKVCTSEIAHWVRQDALLNSEVASELNARHKGVTFQELIEIQ